MKFDLFKCNDKDIDIVFSTITIILNLKRYFYTLKNFKLNSTYLTDLLFSRHHLYSKYHHSELYDGET